MQGYEDKLLHSYEREEYCYMRILELAGKEREALREGCSMNEVISILKDKKKIMQEIESIERSIAQEKRFHRRCRGRSAAVVAAVESLSSLVEKILSVERENEILFSTAGHSMRGSDSENHVSADFVLTRYNNSG